MTVGPGTRAVTYPPPTATFGQATTVSGSGFWAFPSGSAVNAVRVEIVVKPPAPKTYGTGIPRYRDLGVYQIVDTAGASRTQQIFQDVRVDRIEYPPGVGVAFDCGEGVSVRLTEVLGAQRVPVATWVVLDFATGTVGPHGQTQRASYTVPAGREAILQTLSATMVRLNAATNPSWHYILGYLEYPTAASTNLLMFVDIDSPPNTVPRSNETPALQLPSGATFQWYTADFAIGGEVNYWASATFREYDAGTLTPSVLDIRSSHPALQSATE